MRCLVGGGILNFEIVWIVTCNDLTISFSNFVSAYVVPPGSSVVNKVLSEGKFRDTQLLKNPP